MVTFPNLPLAPPRPASVSYHPAQATRATAAAQLRDLQERRAEIQAAGLTPPPDQVTLNDQVTFAYDTVRDGQRIAAAPQVRNVGLDYAKLSVSNDARKVGAAYVSAAFRGDGKDLERLGKTPLVKKVGNEFHQLSESSAVQRVGDAFEKFGKSVAREFNKLFGLD